MADSVFRKYTTSEQIHEFTPTIEVSGGVKYDTKVKIRMTCLRRPGGVIYVYNTIINAFTKEEIFYAEIILK